jgi:hypothetical protein
MKKQLIGTTALVSAGLLAGSAVGQDALAADPLSLSIGGYYQVGIEYRDEDDSTGEPGSNLQDLGVYDDGEIQFTASTTLDNGIGVKVRVEMEAKNQGGGATHTDERYLNFSGSFGQLRIGSDDDAAYAMQYQAPVGAYQIGVNTTTFAVPSTGGNAITSYPTTYISASSDSQKVIWFSPRMAGFQLGLSYAPDAGSTNESNLPQNDNDPGEQDDAFSVGLNFVETFGDIDVAVAGGYNQASKEAQVTGGTNVDDLEQFSAGLNVGFSGFTVGASALWSNRGLDNNGDNFTWDAGVTYATGPITVGFTWLTSEVEDANQTSSATAGDDELDSAVISATYNMGPGVDVWGGVKWFDYQSADNDDADENEGYILAIGSSVSF